MQVIKFDLAHYFQEDVLLRVNKINDTEIALLFIRNVSILSLVESFHAYEFEHVMGTLSVTTIAAPNHFKKSKGAMSDTPRVLD